MWYLHCVLEHWTFVIYACAPSELLISRFSAILKPFCMNTGTNYQHEIQRDTIIKTRHRCMQCGQKETVFNTNWLLFFCLVFFVVILKLNNFRTPLLFQRERLFVWGWGVWCSLFIPKLLLFWVSRGSSSALVINNYFSSPNRFSVNSPWGQRSNELLTQRLWVREE